MEGSILESIGTDLISIISPVSICMLLVVLLISSLSPPPSLSSPTTPIITAANLIYSENPSDSPTQKLEGAALNAVVFVVLIAAVTFLLVLLYYYNFTNFLKNYMRFSAFLILATMGGAICLSLIRHFSIPIDSITCFVLLINFSVVGVVSVFGRGVPIFVTQCYTVVLGIITAAWFTQLPEWTTWVLLVALAVYDLVAVLAPGGPLKILVELSQSRDDDLPALVYEARPTVASSNGRRGGLGFLVGGVSDNGSVELQNLSRNDGQIRDGVIDVERVLNEEIESSPLVPNVWGPPETSPVNEERSPLMEIRGNEEGGDSEEVTMSRVHIFPTLKLAREHHRGKLIVETDSQKVAWALKHRRQYKTHIGRILRDCFALAESFESISFEFARRSCDRVAHELARGAVVSKSSIVCVSS